MRTPSRRSGACGLPKAGQRSQRRASTPRRFERLARRPPEAPRRSRPQMPIVCVAVVGPQVSWREGADLRHTGCFESGGLCAAAAADVAFAVVCCGALLSTPRPFVRRCRTTTTTTTTTMTTAHAHTRTEQPALPRGVRAGDRRRRGPAARRRARRARRRRGEGCAAAPTLSREGGGVIRCMPSKKEEGTDRSSLIGLFFSQPTSHSLSLGPPSTPPVTQCCCAAAPAASPTAPTSGCCCTPRTRSAARTGALQHGRWLLCGFGGGVDSLFHVGHLSWCRRPTAAHAMYDSPSSAHSRTLHDNTPPRNTQLRHRDARQAHRRRARRRGAAARRPRGAGVLF